MLLDEVAGGGTQTTKMRLLFLVIRKRDEVFVPFIFKNILPAALEQLRFLYLVLY